MATRTLTTDKGLSVVTDLTDDEAYQLLVPLMEEGRLSTFGCSLVLDYRQYRARLSSNKLPWLHAYALAVIDAEMKGDYGIIDLYPGHQGRPK